MLNITSEMRYKLHPKCIISYTRNESQIIEETHYKFFIHLIINVQLQLQLLTNKPLNGKQLCLTQIMHQLAESLGGKVR